MLKHDLPRDYHLFFQTFLLISGCRLVPPSAERVRTLDVFNSLGLVALRARQPPQMRVVMHLGSNRGGGGGISGLQPPAVRIRTWVLLCWGIGLIRNVV